MKGQIYRSRLSSSGQRSGRTPKRRNHRYRKPVSSGGDTESRPVPPGCAWGTTPVHPVIGGCGLKTGVSTRAPGENGANVGPQLRSRQADCTKQAHIINYTISAVWAVNGNATSSGRKWHGFSTLLLAMRNKRNRNNLQQIGGGPA